jgi:hypothetical protein
MRELNMSFGDSGYLALCRPDANADAVYVLVFRLQKTVGY